MNKVSVIVPFLNEEENMPFLLQTIDEFASKQSFPLEFVMVDDGSTDASLEIISNFAPRFFDLKLLSFSRNFGSHAALRAGISKASGDFISFLYADLQDPMELILSMKAKMEAGADITWGHREIDTKIQSFASQVFSNWYNALMRKHVNPNFPKSGFDVVMINQKVASELNKNVESNSSIFLQILNLGFTQEAVYYKKEERKKGKSKWTFSKKVKLFIDSFVAFSYFPIRFVSVMGIIFFILGVLWTFYVLARAIIVGDLQSGWPTTIAVLMIGFGITNIGLGVIAEYLWRTLDASRDRPVFVIKEIIEKKKSS